MSNTAFNVDDNIIKQLGLQDMPEEQRMALLDQMADLVQKRTMIRVMEELPEDHIEEANKLAEEPEKLLDFVSSKVNMAEILVEETQRLKDELFLKASEPTAEEVVNPPVTADQLEAEVEPEKPAVDPGEEPV